MSNGIRHVLGLVLGLIAVPSILMLLYESNERQKVVLQTFQATGTAHWVEMACFAGVAVLIGLVSGSRISPLASLVPGLVFGAIGVLFAVQPNNNSGSALPSAFRQSYLNFGASGLALILGGGLLIASLFPARWRSRQAASAGKHAYDYDGGGAPYEVGTPRQPGYDEYEGGAPALQYGDQLYSQNPEYRQGSELYGRQVEQPPAFGRPPDEPERPGWAAPPPGPSPFN